MPLSRPSQPPTLDLRVVPVDRIIAHETYDPQRATPLINLLQRDRHLKNPPIVTSIDLPTADFLILDGTNRVEAFRQLGYEHIIVQHIDYQSTDLHLASWQHVI
ncbi:MAG: hypothetical protein GYB68_13015, partial [Chloroflexi bacterium]|nr:hypothetical protein [Chloroflexota bacterium]